MLLYKLDIDHDGSATERRIGPGVVLVGGGLQADLVVPALLDPEVCEIQLPEIAGQPIRLTALVQGMTVNGRELRLKQTVSAASHDIAIDDVVMRISAVDQALVEADEKPKDRVVDWLEKSKGSVTAKDIPALIQKNPAYTLFGGAALLGLLAFLISGFPSAKFKPPELAGKSTTSASDRESVMAMLKEIRRRLTSADLGSVVKAEQAGGAIRLSGIADPAQALRLDEIVRLVSTPGAVTIRNEVVMTSADAATGIEGIVTSPVRGVIVTGGRLFNEGQTIPTGWLVEKIGQNQVTLKRDSVTHNIAMTDAVPAVPDMPIQAKPQMPAQKNSSHPQSTRALEAISSPPLNQQMAPFNSSAQPRVISK